MPRPLVCLALLAVAASSSSAADGWILNDVTRAREIAAEAAKPMLVVFRCVP